MTEKKQNTFVKNTEGKEFSLFDFEKALGDDLYGETGDIETEDTSIKGFNVSIGQGNHNFHFHSEPCTINTNYPPVDNPNDNGSSFLLWFLRQVPLMVKDSSITAPKFFAALLEKLPLMVKDSSITQMEALFFMWLVKLDLLCDRCDRG